MTLGKLLRIGMLLGLSPLAGCGAGEPDESKEENAGQASPGEGNFAVLINNHRGGKVEPTPWTGHFWPLTENGIASGKYTGGKSAAARYDAVHARATSAQSWEVAEHGTGKGQKWSGWEGHCNGWSVAAALYAEPSTPAKVNGIEFSITDIKTLLTEAGMNASADYFGEPMESDDTSHRTYQDTAPGQAFLVLTNYIGRRGQAVLIDRWTTFQKWNQPLAGYRFEYPKPSDYLGARADAPDVYRIQVKGTLWYINESMEERTPTFQFKEEDNLILSRDIKMELWLDGPVTFDASGKITSSGNVIITRDPANPKYFIGGTWLMESVDGTGADLWPDYMWVPYSILPPNPQNANPHIDIEWIKTHLLVPGGLDDVRQPPPSGIEDAPAPRPPSPRPSTAPTPGPMPSQSPRPIPAFL